MRKTIILFSLIFFTIGLHANVDTDKVYVEALQAYKEKDYTDSYEKLKKIYLTNLSDAKLNFYLGRSAYETGHYEVALAAFERVDMLDEGNLRNKLEMARTYFMLQMYEDSELAFKEVLENPSIPQNVRTNIELSLSKVSKVQQTSFTYARIMANILYDSNVNYGSLGDYQYGGTVLPQIKEVSDSALEVYGNIVNIYDIGDKNNFSIKNSVAFYMKDYNQEDAYDLHYFMYSPSLIYLGTNYLVDFAVGVDLMTLNKKSYLQTFFIAPTFEYKHTTTLKSIMKVKYQSKDFKQALYNSQDANRYVLDYALQKILSPRSYLRTNIGSAFERKIRGSSVNVDFNEYKISATYANQFTPLLSMDSFAQVRRRDYRDKSNNFGSKREDLGMLVNLNFGIRILPTLRLNLKGTYEYTDSNQDRFSYEKYTASLGIIKTF